MTTACPISDTVWRDSECIDITWKNICVKAVHTVNCLVRWRLVVWLTGNALASINVVALRQTRLVPGAVTVCGWVNHIGT